MVLQLFVTFGVENFVKGRAVFLTEGIQNLRLDGLLTLIAIMHGNLVGLMNLNRYPEQMKENVKKFDIKRSTDSDFGTYLSLAMRTDPLYLIRGTTEFVTTIYGPAVTFVFPDGEVEVYRMSVLHLNLNSAVDGSLVN